MAKMLRTLKEINSNINLAHSKLQLYRNSKATIMDDRKLPPYLNVTFSTRGHLAHWLQPSKNSMKITRLVCCRRTKYISKQSRFITLQTYFDDQSLWEHCLGISIFTCLSGTGVKKKDQEKLFSGIQNYESITPPPPLPPSLPPPSYSLPTKGNSFNLSYLLVSMNKQKDDQVEETEVSRHTTLCVKRDSCWKVGWREAHGCFVSDFYSSR